MVVTHDGMQDSLSRLDPTAAGKRRIQHRDVGFHQDGLHLAYASNIV